MQRTSTLIIIGLLVVLVGLFCPATALADDYEQNPNVYDVRLSADVTDVNTGDIITLQAQLRKAETCPEADPAETFCLQFDYDEQKLELVEDSAQILTQMPWYNELNPDFGLFVQAEDGVIRLRLIALGDEMSWDIPDHAAWEDIAPFAELKFKVRDWNPDGNACELNFPSDYDAATPDAGPTVLTNGYYKDAALLNIESPAEVTVHDIRLTFSPVLHETEFEPVIAYQKYDLLGLYSSLAYTDPFVLPTPVAVSPYRLLDSWNTSSDGSGQPFRRFWVYQDNQTFHPMVIEAGAAQVDLLGMDVNPALHSEELAKISGLTLSQGQAEITFTSGVISSELAITDDISFIARAKAGYKVVSVDYLLPEPGSQPVPMSSNGGGIYTLPIDDITAPPVSFIVHTSLDLSEDDVFYFTDADVTDPDDTVFRPFSKISGARSLVLLTSAADGLGYSCRLEDRRVYAFGDAYDGYSNGLLLDLAEQGLDPEDKADVIDYLCTILAFSAEANRALEYDGNTNGLPGHAILDVQAVYDFYARDSVFWPVAEELILKGDVVGDAGVVARNGCIDKEDVLWFQSNRS